MPIIKPCAICGGDVVCKPSNYDKKKTCSLSCMGKLYSLRNIGSNNPNFKNAGIRKCGICGKTYQSYNKKSKYCSWSCSGKSPDNLKKLSSLIGMPRKKRPVLGRKLYDRKCVICGTVFKTRDSQSCSKVCANKLHSIRNIRERIPNRECEQCGKKYHSYNKKRKFCSYVCSVENGTPFRAGAAKIEKMKKYGNKKDHNHKIICEYLQKSGCFVRDLSSAGFGVPDLLVWNKSEWILVEIKNPKTSYGKRGLNPIQRKWAENWKGGKVYILSSIEEAELFVQRKYDSIRCFPK